MRTKKSTPYLFLAPYLILFLIFIIIPTIMAVGLSFTNYNAVQAPQFVGLTNYINLLTQDTIFRQYVLPNTILCSVIVGPLGYLLAFFLAWSLSQLTRVPRTILALIIYSPSMTMGVAMTVMWRVVFLGDQSGIANYVLTQLGVITEPIVWMLNTQYILPIVIIVALWSSMGVGFLAMLAGLLNINAELYEAGAIDGIKNRIQEVFYITIPSMKPQMLFGAVMSIVGAFQAGNIGKCIEECIELAAQMAAENEKVFVPNQFENADNVAAHLENTGLEILRQVDGPIDAFCSGIGTGGTITGIGRILKGANPDIRICACEPEHAAILSGGSIGTHLQMGIGDGVIPAILDTEIYSEIRIVTDAEAISTTKELAAKEGILCGISSGTNVSVALKLARELGKGKTVVTVLPDTGERYFSTILFGD